MIRLNLQLFGGRGAASILSRNAYARWSVSSIQQEIERQESRRASNMLYATMTMPAKSDPGYTTLKRRINSARKNVQHADDELIKLQQAYRYAKRYNRDMPF